MPKRIPSRSASVLGEGGVAVAETIRAGRPQSSTRMLGNSTSEQLYSKYRLALYPAAAPKKDSIGDDGVEWELKGQSLVRRTAESFGFVADPAA